MRNGRASSFFFLAVIGCLLMVGGIGVDRWMLTGSRPPDRWHGDTAHAEGVIGMTVDEEETRASPPPGCERATQQYRAIAAENYWNFVHVQHWPDSSGQVERVTREAVWVEKEGLRVAPLVVGRRNYTPHYAGAQPLG